MRLLTAIKLSRTFSRHSSDRRRAYWEYPKLMPSRFHPSAESACRALFSTSYCMRHASPPLELRSADARQRFARDGSAAADLRRARGVRSPHLLAVGRSLCADLPPDSTLAEGHLGTGGHAALRLV